MTSTSRKQAGSIAIVAAWTVYGLVHAFFLMATAGKGEWTWGQVLPAALFHAWGWAALTPAIFALARLAAPARVGWASTIATHALGAVVVATLVTLLRRFLSVTLTGATNLEPFLRQLVFWADVNVFTYVAVVFVGVALGHHRRYRDRTVRTHLLETQLTRAHLQFLELQLQPHFLFNSLNAIQELAHEAPKAAERMLRRLHTLLALSLERSGRDEVTLEEELAALEAYLDIQKVRFSDWLSVDMQVDPLARRALVPHLILQPIVENAIRHGLSVRPGAGHVAVSAVAIGGRLTMAVRDDGVGLPADRTRLREGIGLRNARERLKQLYTSDHRFELREAPGGGTIVELEIPLRFAADAAPATSSDAVVQPEPTRAHREMEFDDIASWRTGEYEAALAGRSAPDPRPRLAVAMREAARASSVETARATSHGNGAEPPMATVATRATESREFTVPNERPRPEPITRLTARTWLGFMAVIVAAALFWTVQISVYYRLRGIDDGLRGIMTVQFAMAGAWAVLSPLMFFLIRRFRVSVKSWLPAVVVHVVAANAFALAHLWILGLTGLSQAGVFSSFNINPITGDFFAYFGVLAWSHSRDFVAWYRARETDAARLTSEIVQSRFQALCVQVRPQFLLGTLEVLASLVHTDVPRAERLIVRLADVLRGTLDMARERMTTLRQELALLATYIEAHDLGVRPGARLDLRVDQAAFTATLPSRLLSTMVDDLLAPGNADPSAPLVVRVTAERGADATRIRLEGDAAWRTAPSGLHAWWRKKSVAEAAVEEAGHLVTVAFPDRATAVLVVADESVPPPMDPTRDRAAVA